MKYSLKTKLSIIFLLMIGLTVTIEMLNLKYIRLPQLISLEANSDQKDIKRIKIAFKSMVKELGVINYDNAVWDEAYDYVDNRDPQFPESNFVIDAFQSLDLNGIHIYDRQGNTVWSRTWDRDKTTQISFVPFDSPTSFVKEYILSADKLVKANGNRPLTRAGFTLLDDQLVMYAATSIFKATLEGGTNGTMVFWRFVDESIFSGLRELAGIEFEIELVKSGKEQAIELSSLGSFSPGSYRTQKGVIFDFYPFSAGSGGMRFIYEAPDRQFETNWFNNSTVMTSILFSLTLLFVSILVHFVIIGPILNAEKLVNSIIKANDRTVRFKSKRKDELGTLFNLIDRLLDDVTSKEQELKSHNVRLQKISRTDGLTNIANRRALDKYMERLLNNSESGLEVSLLVCDVDYFKKYNDFYGHALGDKVLRLIADSLHRNLHQDTDFVARYGGEEFVVVLTNTNENQAIAVANNLLRSIRNLKILHEESDIAEMITLSIGIHTFDVSEQKQYEPMFKKADEALYKAKRDGRNRVCTASD